MAKTDRPAAQPSSEIGSADSYLEHLLKNGTNTAAHVTSNEGDWKCPEEESEKVFNAISKVLDKLI
ncbi:MAG: hypothetical protein HQL74_02875 [Magnetococcales bacterium]|nr:hypothetical protein [Magnetococcales bacterium]